MLKPLNIYPDDCCAFGDNEREVNDNLHENNEFQTQDEGSDIYLDTYIYI